MTKISQNHKESGKSIAGLIVALGISMLVVRYASDLVVRSKAHISKVDAKHEKLQIRDEIRRTNDCQETLKICRTNCNVSDCGSKIELFKKARFGGGLIVSNGDELTVISGYYTKAECNRCVNNCPVGITANEAYAQVYLSKNLASSYADISSIEWKPLFDEFSLCN